MEHKCCSSERRPLENNLKIVYTCPLKLCYVCFSGVYVKDQYSLAVGDGFLHHMDDSMNGHVFEPQMRLELDYELKLVNVRTKGYKCFFVKK